MEAASRFAINAACYPTLGPRRSSMPSESLVYQVCSWGRGERGGTPMTEFSRSHPSTDTPPDLTIPPIPPSPERPPGPPLPAPEPPLPEPEPIPVPEPPRPPPPHDPPGID